MGNQLLWIKHDRPNKENRAAHTLLHVVEMASVEQLKGDTREFLNAKRTGQQLVENSGNDDSIGQQKTLQVLAGTTHKMDTVQECGTGELVVADAGKKIEQNSNLDEIPIDRALARVAQGLQVKRIGHEFQSNEQLQMLKFQAVVDQQNATLKEGLEVVSSVDDFGQIRQ